MEKGGVDVVAIGLFDSLIRPLIAFAASHTAFNAAASQPGREREWIMVASFLALAARHAAKFTGPHHDGIIQQPTRSKVGGVCRGGSLHAGAHFTVVLFQVFVRIPVAARNGIVGAAPKLDETDTTLEQKTRNQAITAD